ncbi:MAG: helix-turn-helix domain-containing protein [Candidatus Merdivicinus sp.]|jgi:AraC-like DNA-binding protein
MNLPTQYLNPVVLRCCYYNGYNRAGVRSYATRMVYDYELEYYLRSDGGIRVDGQLIRFGAGEMNIRKPGQMVQGVPPYECYILCVDFVGNSSRSPGYSFGCPEEAQERYENPLLSSMPDRLVISKRDLMTGLFENIVQNQENPSDLARFQVKSSLYFLFSEIFREISDQKTSGSTAAVREVIRQIREHFCESLCVEDLIAETGLSRAFFHRRFLAETGMTPGQLIASLRIEQAKNLLSFTSTPIGEVGALCGYPDSVYFSRIFHRQTGMTPSAYRRRVESELSGK